MLPKNLSKCQGCAHRFDCIKLLASVNVAKHNDAQQYSELLSRLEILGFADYDECKLRTAPDKISAFTNSTFVNAKA